MQELLGRIARLDPSASLGLRVIACFDELMVGNVNTRALLAAAASLAGCIAGFHSETPARTVRIDPRGHHADDIRPEVDPAFQQDVSDGLTVWLERNGARQPNDAIVLERLALAVRMRPRNLDDVVGQQHLLGQGSPLRQLAAGTDAVGPAVLQSDGDAAHVEQLDRLATMLGERLDAG